MCSRHRYRCPSRWARLPVVKLGIGGISLQIAALVLLAQAGTSTPLLLAFLLSQGIAAAMLAMVLWRMLPRRFRVPFAWSYGYLFAFCFLVPLAGALVCTGSLL